MSTRDSRVSPIRGAWNYRDLGGLCTPDGLMVRGGRLHRSSALTDVTDDAHSDVLDLGITDVFDLRSSAEVARHGADNVPAGVQVHRVPYEELQPDAPHADRPDPDDDSVVAHMLGAYDEFPTLPGASAAIASVVDALTSDDRSVLVHCAAGKDRAGWTVATVLRAAGVRESDILADYLRSNDAIEDLRGRVLRTATPEDAATFVLTDAMLGVRPEYYDAAVTAMIRDHGSTDGYLRSLGIDDTTRHDLRAALLTIADTARPGQRPE